MASRWQFYFFALIISTIVFCLISSRMGRGVARRYIRGNIRNYGLEGIMRFETNDVWKKLARKNEVTLNRNSTHDGFVVFTEGCQIPAFDPYDRSLSQIDIVGKGRGKDCFKFPRHIDINPIENSVSLSKKKIRSLGVATCEWQVLIREETSDDVWSWTHPVEFNATEKTRIPGDFALIRCRDLAGRSVVKNFAVFGFADEAKSLVKRRSLRRHLTDIGANESFNVFLIGIDSVSRNNLVRNFPETREFLFRYLDPIEYFGYNKVGDNTLVNFIPFLAGKYLKDLPWDGSKVHLPFDDYPFIWKNFSQRGYWTLFGEDSHDIHTFNYLSKGFYQRPTDHYFRHFLLAVDDFLKEEPRYCKGCRKKCYSHFTQDRWLYEWFLNAVRSHKNDRLFALIWSNMWTHTGVAGGRNLDGATKRLFKTLHEEGLLRDTFIFFFSDHGSRHGAIRETFAGKFEERLPMMYVILPEKLRRLGGRGREGRREENKEVKMRRRRRREVNRTEEGELEEERGEGEQRGEQEEEKGESKKDLAKKLENLKRNSRRLTTHFDLYETLLDLADFGGKRINRTTTNSPFISDVRFRYSLFDRVPENRTCEDATIKSHFCTCQKLKEMSVEHPVVVKVAKFLVDQINKDVKSHKNLCSRLSLNQIKDAYATESSEHYLKFLKQPNAPMTDHFIYGKRVLAAKNLMVVVETIPGKALLEGTVRVWETADPKANPPMTLEGDVSRINWYGNSSHCITDKRLKKYCYCI